MATTPATPATPAGVQPITVVYGVDNRFAMPLAASIQSALDHLGPQQRLDIHIIDGGISRRNRSRLVRSFENRPCRLVWLEPRHGKLSGLKVGGAITVATYYRLLIPQLLPEHAKAIYLDADLIVQRSLGDLWSVSLADHHLLAVQDQGVRLISGPFGLKNYRALQIPEGRKYFNAGVLVLDLERWRRDNIADTVMTYVSEQAEHIRFHDQDGLNAILWSRWGELDPRWNQMPQILQVRTVADGPFDATTLKNVREEPYIIHYASADKPWHFGCRHPATALFFRYLDRTAYRGFRPSRWQTGVGNLRDYVGRWVTRLAAAFRGPTRSRPGSLGGPSPGNSGGASRGLHEQGVSSRKMSAHFTKSAVTAEGSLPRFAEGSPARNSAVSRNCVFFSYHDSGNRAFFEKGLSVAVESVRRTNPTLPIFLLHDGLGEAEQQRLSGCSLIRIDSSHFEYGQRPDLTIGAYFKLHAGELAEFERALYLDSDLVVLDRLDELFAHPGWLAARREQCDLAHEFVDPERVARQERLTDRSAMMNSGVVLFDPKVWKAERMLERSLEIGHAYGWEFFRNSDQGILDILAHRIGGFRELSVRFNFCRWPDMQYSRIVPTALNRAGLRAPYVLRGWRRRLVRLSGPRWVGAPTATIVHWNGPVKPWQFREKGENAERFLLECYEQFTSNEK